MRPLSLGKILIGVNVGLVVVTVLGVVAGGLTHLERLAAEQATGHVRLAGAAARHAVERSRDDVRVSAQILAERPTLARLLAGGEIAALEAFVDRYRSTSRMTGCSVWRQGEMVVATGPPELWRGAAQEPDDWGYLPPAEGAPLTLVASARVASVEGARVKVALALDDAAAAGMGREIGMPVTLLDRDAARRAGSPDRQAQRAAAIESGRPQAARLAAERSFVASFPLEGAGGEAIGIIEVDLPDAGIVESLRALGKSLWGVALAVALLAGVLGVVLARRLARPLQALTRAAVGIGGGDLATPIPHAAGAEAGTLAASMEEMRRRLLSLTGELRRKQAEAEAVLAGIAEGVFSVDRDRRVRYLNPQAAALLGIRPEQAIGRFCGDLLDPEPVDGERPCEERCPILDARFRGTARATEHLRAGGRTRSVVVTSAPLEPAGAGVPGEPEQARQFQVLRDETDVEGARRARDAVLANISHEFRTPLAAQIASLELLRDRLPEAGAEEARRLVQSLERGALRLSQLIDNLLESVRIESGELSIRHAKVALDEVVEAAVETTAPLLAQRQQRISVDLPYPLPPLVGDAPRLTQVLVNLLANASKFSPPGAAIRIGAESGPAEIALWVDDEGPGLPSGAGESLFERFVRDPARASGGEPEAGGVGLGLWIVRSIVGRHGGRVEAAAGPERGTRVRLVLPLGDGAGPAAPPRGGA